MGGVGTQLRTGSLRVLLVTPRYLPDIGGTEVHTKELAERLAALGHDVTVLTTDRWDELPAVEWASHVRIRRVRVWPADRDYYFAPGIFRVITNRPHASDRRPLSGRSLTPPPEMQP